MAMGRWQIGFEYPWYLLLLLLLPGIWWLGFRSLAGLGTTRRLLALVFRSLVVCLIVAALAGVQWIWTTDRVTVIYLLDQSDSIPQAKRDLMLQYAIDSVKEHRNQKREDRAGLIVFGREAALEFPPLNDNLPPIKRPESYLGKTDATNLESALKLAQASFPEDSARRIVVITDGNETLGNVSSIAKSLADAGIGIDVVPIRLDSSAEVLVEKIDVPANVRQGQTIDAKVVLQRYLEPGDDKPVEGTLKVTRRVGNQSQLLADVPVTLDRDVNVIPIPDKVEQTAGYTYEAEFIRKESSGDSITQNNRATAFSYVRGKGRVMLIEDTANKGDYSSLVDCLRRNEIEVDVFDTSRMFSSLIELQTYDCVILAGVPRTSGEAFGDIQSFNDDQVEMLIRNTQQFGAGLLMIGGPEAFGAGGWANTKLEEAMPVDFQIKNTKIEAVGALAMVMHASEIAQGNYWQKMIGRSALDVLGPMDYCGVLEYDMLGTKWMWGGRDGMLKVGPNRQAMRSQMSRMTPGDMPDFDPAMKMALNSLVITPASTKHMIVISDGDPTPSSPAVLAGFKKAQIKVSTVAVGAHGPAGHNELQRIANATGGNYYVVTNPSVLPKIFVREARRVARPLIFEPDGGVAPQITFRHEVLQGISEPVPRLKGFVLTQRKESPLVEVPLLSPVPTEKENATLLATWTYGLGRTAVFTSDSGKRWADGWTNWNQYDQFFSQLVRWTMRPTNDDGKFQMATNVRDGKVQVIVTAMDQDDRFMNFLDMSGVGVTPDLKPFSVDMKQTAPGRYVGEFPVGIAGSYMLSVVPAPGRAPLTTGVNVPYSNEYRVRQANLGLLEQMASLTPTGGNKGELSDPLEPQSLKDLLAVDRFRGGLPHSRSLQDIWPWAVLLGASLFFADVFVRRVALDLGAPLRWLAARWQPAPSAQDQERMQRLERLRGQKSVVGDQIDKNRASLQFDAETDASTTTSASQAFSKAAERSATPAELVRPDLQTKQEESYTSRLLQAKRHAQRKPKEKKDH
jgi:uncharacterized membrane protein